MTDVLDLFAATQPYRDLLPAHETYVSMDIDEHYGPQDVVSDEFLPFADEAFDLILFTEGFHYVTEPEHGAGELRRVLRPGGTGADPAPGLGVRPANRRAPLHRAGAGRAVRGLGRRFGGGDRRLHGGLGDVPAGSSVG